MSTTRTMAVALSTVVEFLGTVVSALGADEGSTFVFIR